MAFRSGSSSPRLSVSSWTWTEVLHHSKWQLDGWIQRLCIPLTWKNGECLVTFWSCIHSPRVRNHRIFTMGTKKTLGRPSIKAAKWSNGNTSEAGSFRNGVLKGFWKVPPTFLEILLRKLSTNVSLEEVRRSDLEKNAFHLKICNMSHQEFPQSCVSIHHCHWTSVEKVCRTHRSNDIDPEPGWGQWCIRVWRIYCHNAKLL